MHFGWGLWRDEFYYLACGQRLAWGYVDHGPVVALQARLAVALFGRSLAGIRLFVALASAARVFLTGLLTFRLGGRRPAQALAMTVMLVAPAYLGSDSVLNMGPFEPIFWMTCILLLLGMQRRLGLSPLPSTCAENVGAGLHLRARVLHSAIGVVSPALIQVSLAGQWIAFGLCAGIGLLNKQSMSFFLVALALGLLLTRVGRALLLRREALLGLTFTIVLAAPNLLWQIQNDWPTLEFLEAIKHHKNGVFDPLTFLGAPVFAFLPATLAIWAAGLIYLLRRARTRALGWTYLFFLGIMVAASAKDYYTFPIYPLLFAAGSVAWERVFGAWQRSWNFTVGMACLALATVFVITFPTFIPTFTPTAWLRDTAKHDLYVPPPGLGDASPLPPFFADRFGWKEEATEVHRIVSTLSPSDRAELAIICDNYAEAGSLRFYAPDLPPALSGQNSFYLWGFGNASGRVLLYITGRQPDDLRRFYGDVTLVGTLNHSPYMLAAERHQQIYLLRDPHQDMPTFWRSVKVYI